MENDTFNVLQYEHMYNGGGVAIGDFNNDNLSDIFFTGNMVPNQLYLNRGDLKFEDVTDDAMVNVAGRWNQGAAAVDINGDGWLDLYVCASLLRDSSKRENMLFINQGLNEKGRPVFKEEAKSYGINDNGFSMNAAFFDYDLDGDLDLYVLTDVLDDRVPTNYRPKVNDGSSPNNDRLYRNNGNGTFTNVTKAAGIRFEGFGLGLAVSDFNFDGWPDLYIGNDYISNDLLYINNGDGTFSNRIADYIKHQSQFSMGNDVGDINNDGLPEIVTLDMLSEYSLRRKTMTGGTSYTTYIYNREFGYEFQHTRNMLHLNNGVNVPFSEIGQLARMQQTDWSWSPLLVDFDNDGFRDLLITNGFPRDVTDKDFSNFRDVVGLVASPDMLLDSIPIVKISNYAYRNRGDLKFEDVTETWGLQRPSFSNGAAFADLDNDGDLDYVVNNIGDPAFVYKNTLNDNATENEKRHFLRIKLKGKTGNSAGLGAKIKLHYGNGNIQYHDHSVSRGFLSSVEEIVHFGLGSQTTVDSLVVTWPDGKTSRVTAIKTDQVVVIDHKDATASPYTPKQKSAPLFLEVADKTGIKYLHEETDIIDFNLQRTIPHKFSQYGPGISVGDINQDGLDDFFIGGAAGHPSTFWVQGKDGKFNQQTDRLKYPDNKKKQEDLGTLLFDADGDGDNDLYCVSGSLEWEIGSSNYQDRLYVNNGKGYFAESRDALPPETASGSCVRAGDFDGDGDLDLFVGGRVVPGRYPLPGESFLLQNDKGKFTDATEALAPGLKQLGMITDAIWSDFDGDQRADLIVTGELMAISFFKNTGKGLSNVTGSSGIDDKKGWWNSIASADFDHDGDMDYIVGNLGNNNIYRASKEQPVKVFAKDFDGNGSIDPVVSCYLRSENGLMQPFPVHFWDELNSQSPKFRRKFSLYKQYGRATVDKLLTQTDLEGALVLEGNYSATSMIENLGEGKFGIMALPVEAQFAPVTGILVDDFDNDSYKDILMIGNDFGNEIFSGRFDAFNGLLLKGKGGMKFQSTPVAEAGFLVPGDARSLVRLVTSAGDPLILASQNRDSLKVFRGLQPVKSQLIQLQDTDFKAAWTTKDGKRQVEEFYNGHGFLSQSSRKWPVPAHAQNLTIISFSGVKRNITL